MKNIFIKSLNLGAVLAALLFMVTLAAPAQAQQGGKATFPIAVVDVGKVFKDSKEGQAIDKKLRDEGQALEKTMQKKDNDLKKAYEDLIQQAQSGNTTKEALENKEKELQKRIQAFQVERAKAIEDMNKKAEETLKPLQDKTEKAIKTLANDTGFVVVLNSAGVVYAPDSIDITDKVIQEIDKPVKR